MFIVDRGKMLHKNHLIELLDVTLHGSLHVSIYHIILVSAHLGCCCYLCMWLVRG